jgi:hypothetical protein
VRRIALVLTAAALMAAMVVVASPLPALAVNTGDANQNPPQGSGGYRLPPPAQDEAAQENAQNENAATVLHCSGGPPGPTREGAVVTEGGPGGEQIGSSECQDPPRNEEGDKVGFLGGPPPP